MCQLCVASFQNLYTDDQKLFKNEATFDNESFCVKEDKLRETNTKILIGMRVEFSVSIHPTGKKNQSLYAHPFLKT